eukprot:3939661-Rhodomonas_salina.2
MRINARKQKENGYMQQERGKRTEVMAVDGDDLPAVGLIAGGGVLGLGVLSHLVEGHVCTEKNVRFVLRSRRSASAKKKNRGSQGAPLES